MKIILIIAIIISSNLSYAQKNDLEKNNLKGKIKKITTTFYTEDLEDGTGFYKTYEEEKWFRIDGQDSLMISKSIRDDFKPKRTSYIYDRARKLETMSEFDIYDNITYVYSYKYDSLNRLIKQHRFSYNDMSYENDYYEYNQEGELIKLESTSSDGVTIVENYEPEKEDALTVLSTDSKKYNKYGDCIYEENSVRISLSDYEYDEFGNWVKWYEWVPKYTTKHSHPSGIRTIEYH